uniref:CSON008471 protein n=1 Tax=Culicoides sonorensis TaxID=179676 RepID=A0A336LN69_CULSO
MKNILIYMSILCLLWYPVVAGPTASSICYAGCAAAVVACYGVAGFTFGTVPGALIAAIPALAPCNTAFATCKAGCVVWFFLPTL